MEWVFIFGCSTGYSGKRDTFDNMSATNMKKLLIHVSLVWDHMVLRNVLFNISGIT